MMKAQQKDLIARSWSTVVPVAGPAMDMFYEEVFSRAPAARGMFPEELGAQKNKLAQTLGFAVAMLDKPRKLETALKKLGQTHAGYGVVPAHYEVVGEALLATLATLHGSLWVPELAAAWTEVYTFVANTMIGAAAQAADEAA